MDSATETGSIFGFISFISSIIVIICTAINHKRIRSHCCGKNMEASLDVENTTPIKAVSSEPPIVPSA